MLAKLLAFVSAALVLTSCGPTPSGHERLPYFVPEYDATRDHFADLDSAVALAKDVDKNILLVVGGNWCAPCLQLDSLMMASELVQDVLYRYYVIVKANYDPRKPNTDFFSKYPNSGFPYLVALRSNGSLIQIFNVGMVFESGSDSLDTESLTMMLRHWTTE